jgi:hypothetical protein
VGRAGFAKIAITPPLGTELTGYGVYLERRATEVHDELLASEARLHVPGEVFEALGQAIAARSP